MNKTIPPHRQSNLLQALRFYMNPIQFLENCIQEYGRVFELTPLGKKRPLYFITDPELIPEVLKHYREAASNEVRVFFGPKAVLTATGDEHADIRRVLMPFFSKKSISKLPISKLVSETFEKMASDASLSGAGVSGETITLDILRKFIGEFYFQGLPESALQEFISISQKITKLGHFLVVLETLDLNVVRKMYGKKYKELNNLFSQIDRFVENVRLAGAHTNDMVSYLIKHEYSTVDIRYLIVELVSATLETLNVGMLWGMLYLGTQDQHRKLIKEEKSPEKRKRLIDNFIKEVLRLRPVVVIYDRSVDYDATILGYKFKKNGRAVILPHNLHLRTFENPDEFDPKRFDTASHSTYEYLPFGSGHRFCLGINLAMQFLRKLVEQSIEYDEFNIFETQKDINYRIRLLNIAPREDYTYRFGNRIIKDSSGPK